MSLEVTKQAPSGRPNPSRGETANTATGSQMPLQNSCVTKRSRAKMDNSQPNKRKKDCGNGRAPLAEGKRGGLSPRLPRVSLKRLLEVENTLVHGEERLGAKSPTAPSSSPASQLMCQGCEIGGPASGPNLSFLPQIDKWLVVAIQAADSYYQQKKYGVAASRLTTALELCSKGAALADQQHADHEDICRLVSYLEARLVVCYLRLKRPELALNHAHRSIHLNPAHFRNHLRQAAAFRLLGQPRAAARSAMIADWLYCLSGGREHHLSSLIKLYWQAMLEEAITLEEGVSVMFSPAPRFGEALGDVIARAEEEFRKRHPTFTEYLYTDPIGDHFLPQTRDWSLGLTPSPSPWPQPQTPSLSGSSSLPQAFLLTLGFRRREEGVFLEKLRTRTWPSFTDVPQGWWSPGEVERSCDILRRRVLPILDLIKSTKLTAGFFPGSGIIERLQYADLLGRLHRGRERIVALQQVLAELSIAPYLQEVTENDAKLLQALMADTTDTLEGRQTSRERVWNKMQKLGQLEDLVRHLEETYRRNKALKADRKQKAPASSRRKHQRKGGPLKNTYLNNESCYTSIPPAKDPGCVEDPSPSSPPGENSILDATLHEAPTVERPPSSLWSQELDPPAL